jgi:radical SAM protein with 4Fe4S-binding SPASM domain
MTTGPLEYVANKHRDAHIDEYQPSWKTASALQASSRDVFDYSEHFFLALTETHAVARPLQVEFHLGQHCDLYRCPHCYGHKQAPIGGAALSRDEIREVLDALVAIDPLIIVSGITTEPLTHPHAAAILSDMRQRNFRLGLFTKGLRFDDACAAAVLTGTSECFVVFSIDAFSPQSYRKLHGLAPNRWDKHSNCSSDDYYDEVLNHIRRLYLARSSLGDSTGSPLQIRVALLLFEDNVCDLSLDPAIDTFASMADVVRLSFPQDRNDGVRPANVPDNRALLLGRLQTRYANHPKVRILMQSHRMDRDQSFRRCHTQRFQITIDKSGNVFPCPQVAVGQYRHLCFGNVRERPVLEILGSAERQARFEWDVTRDMRCRICDRKDETINISVEHIRRLFGRP